MRSNQTHLNATSFGIEATKHSFSRPGNHIDRSSTWKEDEDKHSFELQKQEPQQFCNKTHPSVVVSVTIDFQENSIRVCKAHLHNFRIDHFARSTRLGGDVNHNLHPQVKLYILDDKNPPSLACYNKLIDLRKVIIWKTRYFLS